MTFEEKSEGDDRGGRVCIWGKGSVDRGKDKYRGPGQKFDPFSNSMRPPWLGQAEQREK